MRPGLPRAAEWWLRLLLRLQPHAFRDRHSAEMLEFAADAWSDRAADGSVGAKVATIARLSADAIRSGLSIRFAWWRPPTAEGEEQTASSDAPGIGRLERSRRARRSEEMRKDIGYALRMLRHAPGFSAVVIATLALGIGGTTAVFSVVQAILIAPLPYERPGQLVRLYQYELEDVANHRYKRHLAGPQFREIRDHAASFQDVAAMMTYSEMGLDLVSDGRAERLRVLPVSSGYFRTLGSGLRRGREFDREDEVGTSRLAVLSDGLWRTRFDADPSIIGTTIRLGDQPTEIVGIAAPGLEDPIVGDVDAWIPYRLPTDEQNNEFSAVARLRNGVDLEKARAELAMMSRSIAERWPDADRNIFDVVPLKDDVVRTARAPLRLFLIAVGLVLLLVCVNVANIVFVRATGRAHEFAIRAALGSGGVRIARQLLVESVLLAALGGLLGFALAGLGVDVLKALGRDAIARLDEVAFDPVVLGFAVLVTLATAIAFGVAPAIRFARIDPNRVLVQQSRSATSARRQGRLRSALVAAQLALALTLLAGAGVLMASFHRLQRLDLGFRVERVLTFDLNVSSAAGYDPEQRAIFQDELARRLQAIPGVTAAGGISFLPTTGNFHPWGARIISGPLAGTWVSRGGGTQQNRIVSGAYFTALEIPLLAGRTFDLQDDGDAPPRAVVSESFARQAFPGMPLEDVVGQRIRVGVIGAIQAALGRGRLAEEDIIGVVGDVPLDAHGSPALMVYHAHRQIPFFKHMHVLATELPPEQILPAVRDEVAALDPELVVHDPTPMTEVVGRGVSRERFALALMGAFAAVAAMLAVLGLYGVLAYTVRQRRQEIGIRIALGATPARVRAFVLRQAGIVVGIGLVVGMGGAVVLGRALSSLVFEVSPWDPRILVSTAVGLATAAFLSAWLPARRAARLDPRIAMHEE